MKIIFCQFIRVLTSSLILLSTYSCRQQQVPFQAGSSMIEITPQTGYIQENGGTSGVKSPLYVKALVMQQGNTRGAILMCDLAVIPGDLSRMVRIRASRETGIPFRNISVAATHIHTGPHHDSIVNDAYRYSKWESEGQLKAADQTSYMSRLISAMTEAIVTADRNRAETEMTIGTGQATGISFNRRYLMTNGRVRFNPGYLNPDIAKPMGPVDPQVHFVLLRPAGKNEHTAALTVFAEHTDTEGGTRYSSDYPFYLQQQLAGIFGAGFISVFGNGPCGNINHIDVERPEDSTRQGVITEKIGVSLATAIRKAIPEARLSRPKLQIDSRVLYLPLQDISDREIQWAKTGREPLYPERTFMENIRRWKILDIERMRQREAIAPSVSGEPWTLPVEIQVYSLDDKTAIVMFPGEVFVEHGLELKRRSPFSNTMLIELANAWIKYIPDRKAYSQGDYEALNSRLVPGSGERMVDEAIEMLQKMSSVAKTN